MMKLEEPRIGNIIAMNLKEFPYNWFKVLEVGSTMKASQSLKGEVTNAGYWAIEEFEPIPITEEWLIKFGFDGYDDDDDPSLKYYKNDTVCLNTYLDLSRMWLRWHGSSAIKYVHQLQNLYFALTQEELTLK